MELLLFPLRPHLHLHPLRHPLQPPLQHRRQPQLQHPLLRPLQHRLQVEAQELVLALVLVVAPLRLMEPVRHLAQDQAQERAQVPGKAAKVEAALELVQGKVKVREAQAFKETVAHQDLDLEQEPALELALEAPREEASRALVLALDKAKAVLQ